MHEQFARTSALMNSGKFRKALPLAQELLKGAEASGDPTFTASVKVTLGVIQAVLADHEAAAANLLDAIRLADVAQDDRVRAQGWVSLMQAEFGRGQYERVLFLKGPALGACERLGDEWLKSELLLFQGGALCQLGRAKEAQPLFEEAVRLRVKLYGEGDHRTSWALSALGNALAMQGDLAGGIDAHRKALASAQAALGARHPNTGTLHGNLGSDYLYGLEAARAVAEMEQALAIVEAANGPRQVKAALALTDLGLALLEAGEHPRALETFERAEGLWRELAPKHPERAEALLGRNLAARALGKPVSVAELESAVELSRALPDFQRGRIQLELGLALASGKVSPRALALVKEAKASLSTSTLPLVQRELGRANEWLLARGATP
jgi:tetratricopeptide (TPR) repeat protein